MSLNEEKKLLLKRICLRPEFFALINNKVQLGRPFLTVRSLNFWASCRV